MTIGVRKKPCESESESPYGPPETGQTTSALRPTFGAISGHTHPLRSTRTIPYGYAPRRTGAPYFEFSTRFPDEVSRVLRENRHDDRVDVQEVREPLGQACQNCGNIVGAVLPTVCPNCHFRDVSACPVCHDEVPRQNYERIGGDLFRCPHCQSRVRLPFNEPMFLDEGAYNQPLILVEQAENHEVQV